MARKAPHQPLVSEDRSRERSSDADRARATDGDPEPFGPQVTHPASDSVAHDLGEAASDLPLRVASQLRDPSRYAILGEHGRGGLGKVSRALDRDLGRDVAIKELISRTPTSEARFLREALITARLEHPGIVPVHEAGCWPDGTPFYAMKLVAGRPLRDLIAERTTVPDRLILLHHVIAVTDAIAYAHGRNVIHRDLKPANVIVGDFGETVVIDWGLAKDLTMAEDVVLEPHGLPGQLSDITSTGVVLGTPTYMAPEQARGEPVDQRADVFALGAMLWELCSLNKVPPLDDRVRRRLLRAEGVDRDLGAIVDKALDRDPSRRYADAGALAADLRSFQSGRRIAAREYSLLDLLRHWTTHHRALTFGLLASALLISASITYYVHNISNERDRADAAVQASDMERRATALERDRAQLSEATLLLNEDPTKARALLASLKQRSAQYSLLVNRADRLSAFGGAVLTERIINLRSFAGGQTVAATTADGALVVVDTDTNQTKTLDHDLRGASALDDHGLLYAVRRPGSSHTTVTYLQHSSADLDAGRTLTDWTAQLASAMGHVYALDNHDLYQLEPGGPTLYARDIRSIAGGPDKLLVCSTSGLLTIMFKTGISQRARCAANPSTSALVVAGEHYAYLESQHTLRVSRHRVARAFPVNISGEYALALSEEGTLALADYGGKAWLSLAAERELKTGPPHAASPSAVAANGTYVAWGYADGYITVLDTRTNASWEFKAHAAAVSNLVLDVSKRHIASSAGAELKLWSLPADAAHPIAGMATRIFNIARGRDGRHIALDAVDGEARLWDTVDGSVTPIHRHSNLAFGIAWWNDRVCSSSFDGSALCTRPGQQTERILASQDPVRWITSSPDHSMLAAGTSDGTVWGGETKLQALYSHSAPPYRMNYTNDNVLLASGAFDGSLAVHNFSTHATTWRRDAHTALVTTVQWRDRELWSAGADGAIRRWIYDGDALRPLSMIAEAKPVRFFRLLKDGWLANVGDRYLVIASTLQAIPLRIDLGRHVNYVEMSADEHLVVVALTGEAVVIDRDQRSISTTNIRYDGSGYVGFLNDHLLIVSGPSRTEHIDLDTLHKTTF
jgi:serine/threonine protein kinase/WD40 repeat protein